MNDRIVPFLYILLMLGGMLGGMVWMTLSSYKIGYLDSEEDRQKRTLNVFQINNEPVGSVRFDGQNGVYVVKIYDKKLFRIEP